MKTKSVVRVIREVKNCGSVLWSKYFGHAGELTMVEWRGGLNFVCRSKPGDWFVVEEILFKRVYSKIFEYIKHLPPESIVYDIGGNIGLFSLMASQHNHAIKIKCFEPGVNNSTMIEANLALNPSFKKQIELFDYAVGGFTKQVYWKFESGNPGMSFINHDADGIPVQQKSFQEIIDTDKKIALVKMDIEGSEFEAWDSASDTSLDKIQSIAIEIHKNNEDITAGDRLISRFTKAGYQMNKIDHQFYFFIK